MVEPGARVSLGRVAASAEGCNSALSDDGTDFARTSGDSMRGGAVASWEALARDDEGGGVGAPVEEELDQDVDGQHGVGAEVLKGEALFEVSLAISFFTCVMTRLLRTQMMKRMVRSVKPASWRGLRPTVSIVATASQYPGIAPAQTRMALPAAILYSLRYRSSPLA